MERPTVVGFTRVDEDMVKKRVWKVVEVGRDQERIRLEGRSGEAESDDCTRRQAADPHGYANIMMKRNTTRKGHLQFIKEGNDYRKEGTETIYGTH